ncbi:MAG: dihydrodipicolinate synthase family protein [Spirochaetales bacterium]|jgi:dihydrodipicolinate synthase/N-acetylneuraminate lyase|nr:dihydrodipicolinate synthase family protein [Spirochaetales bacterium]
MSNKLTSQSLQGIWAGLTMCWDDEFRFDTETYSRNIERMLNEKVYGMYTTGSTGEFYAIDYDEYKDMVDIVSDLCGKAAMALQIGCCSDATHKTIKLLEYAAGKEAVGGIQVNIPYWMELTDRELIQFFKDLYNACPDMPLIHYNIPRAKRFLTGDDYLRIKEAAPNLIGSKFTFAGTYFGELQNAIIANPDISFFVAENLLVSSMQIGARGCYSSIVGTNPAITLGMYAKSEAHQWDEAIQVQNKINRFITDFFGYIEQRGEGLIDPVADKGMGIASGCLVGHQRCRPPYIGWSNDTIDAARDWLRRNCPDFLFPAD